MSSSKPLAEGINFPTNEKGERSTMEANKKIFAASFAAMDKKISEEVVAERNWRANYTKWIRRHVETSLQSPEMAMAGARSGLDWMYQNFDFIRDGKAHKLEDAMKTFKKSIYHTAIIEGKKPREKTELVVPYKGKELRGDALLAQLKKWSDKGTIEPSAAEAITQVVKNPNWTDLSDRYFVLLGAGSAMGPYLVLTALGANIIALDLDRPNIWKRLITIAEESPAKLIFPVKKPQNELSSKEDLYSNAGANIITHAPEIADWVEGIEPSKPLVVGCYVYLDGEAHVKVVLACDAIIRKLNESRKAGVAFLCTPTDVHVITDEARKAAEDNYNSYSWKNLLVWPLRAVTGRKLLAKNALPPVQAKDGTKFSIVDGLIVPQGPNYALAKRMQHWRAIIARSQGCIASSHVAPSTATASVVHNRTFAWVFGGLDYFEPFEVFQQDTSNAVMSAILIHDLNNPRAVAKPDVPLQNPLALFRENSCHGGVWRCGYHMGTVGQVSAVVYLLRLLRPYILVFVVIMGVVYQQYGKLF